MIWCGPVGPVNVCCGAYPGHRSSCAEHPVAQVSTAWVEAEKIIRRMMSEFGNDDSIDIADELSRAGLLAPPHRELVVRTVSG